MVFQLWGGGGEGDCTRTSQPSMVDLAHLYCWYREVGQPRLHFTGFKSAAMVVVMDACVTTRNGPAIIALTSSATAGWSFGRRDNAVCRRGIPLGNHTETAPITQREKIPACVMCFEYDPLVASLRLILTTVNFECFSKTQCSSDIVDGRGREEGGSHVCWTTSNPRRGVRLRYN